MIKKELIEDIIFLLVFGVVAYFSTVLTVGNPF